MPLGSLQESRARRSMIMGALSTFSVTEEIDGRKFGDTSGHLSRAVQTHRHPN